MPRFTAIRRHLSLGMAILACLVSAVESQELELLRAKPDPYGFPRPAPGATDVPLATSLFFEVGLADKNATDTVLPESIAVRIGPRDSAAVELLGPAKKFADGCSGKFSSVHKRPSAIGVYLDPAGDLRPSTTYVVSVEARSRDGAALPDAKATWQFTTEDAPVAHSLRFRLDLATRPVRWQGGFFTGFCKPSFCTSASNRIPGYELIDRIRRQSPRAWSLQRDFWLTGMEHQPGFLSGSLPNVVRERETRRITAIQRRDDGMLLRVEDFFGHQQYGIASERPLADDYHPGDRVLIADGISDATAEVLAIVDDSAESKSLLVSPFEEPADGWKIDYAAALPLAEDPDAPGLFPRSGCYLRKLSPAGTPHYYWGRVDREWDIAVRRFGRRLVVNFVDAPGDLSVDGRNWTYPKDYVEYHEFVHACTTHLIDRHGDACLDFVWSVLNEPDLAVAFWRSRDWNELQKFYDYSVDAVLRAFEDRGYDSDRVVVGGLEIGAIFGTHIESPILKIFLNHCSPSTTCEGALVQNAAMIDRRLDGKRSRRVEELCKAWGNRGSPCDFISVHGYNASEMIAAKLLRAKQIALDVDAEYFGDLWVNSFESCPAWAPPPDVAAADSYLGNGYFPTWCADVARRQLTQAAVDARFAFGETILTFWPWPNSNFGGHNNATRVIAIDEDGDGIKDRDETIAMPILNFLGLLARMGDAYWPLAEQSIGPHVVSGFASRGDDAVRVLLYAHNGRDVQSRATTRFLVELDLETVPWPNVRVKKYRFDKEHNSYYREALALRDRPDAGLHPKEDEIARLIADLANPDPAVQIAAIQRGTKFAPLPEEVLVAALALYEKTPHAQVRTAMEEVAEKVQARQTCYAAEDVARIRALSVLEVTGESTHAVDGGALHLPVDVSANGATFLVIVPANGSN